MMILVFALYSEPSGLYGVNAVVISNDVASSGANIHVVN